MKDKTPTPRTSRLPEHFLNEHDNSTGFLNKMILQGSPHDMAIMSILTRLVPYAFAKPETSRASLSMTSLTFDDGGVSLSTIPDVLNTARLLQSFASKVEFVRDGQMPGLVMCKVTSSIRKDKLYVIADPTYRAISPVIPPVC